MAIICSDIARAKAFYADTLGLPVIAETYRAAWDSWKIDLAFPDGARLELVSFPGAPVRPSHTEARGLRHQAFSVADVAAASEWLEG